MQRGSDGFQTTIRVMSIRRGSDVVSFGAGRQSHGINSHRNHSSSTQRLRSNSSFATSSRKSSAGRCDRRISGM
eukprot:630725-Rhodomonas_salina.1